jgi:hypothetical protein
MTIEASIHVFRLAGVSAHFSSGKVFAVNQVRSET